MHFNIIHCLLAGRLDSDKGLTGIVIGIIVAGVFLAAIGIIVIILRRHSQICKFTLWTLGYLSWPLVLITKVYPSEM